MPNMYSYAGMMIRLHATLNSEGLRFKVEDYFERFYEPEGFVYQVFMADCHRLYTCIAVSHIHAARAAGEVAFCRHQVFRRL